MTIDIELKPCPFCGSADVEENRGLIRCGECGADGGAEDHSTSAADYWNRRATLPPATPDAAAAANLTPGAERSVYYLMEAISSFASEWSLVGGRFDRGDMLEQANDTKARIQINLVELCEDSVRNQACAHGSLVDGHAVYCHNSEWAEAPRKCRRTWYTGGETRDEDCEGFKARVAQQAGAEGVDSERLRAADDYHEEYGHVLWFAFPGFFEPPECYVGSPTEVTPEFDDEHWTHFVRLDFNSIIEQAIDAARASTDKGNEG